MSASSSAADEMFPDHGGTSMDLVEFEEVMDRDSGLWLDEFSQSLDMNNASLQPMQALHNHKRVHSGSSCDQTRVKLVFTENQSGSLSATQLLEMAQAAHEKAVHSGFFNDFGDLFDDSDLS